MTIRRADDNTYILASNASATGAAVPVKGGEYMFMVEGTVGGSTLSLQVQSPNGTWADVQVFSGSAVKFTVLPGAQAGVDLPACNVRMAVTGGAASSLFAYLVGCG